MTGEQFGPSPRSNGGYDPQTDTYFTDHDWDGNTELCDTVSRALAALTGRPPTTSAPLSDVVDLDAFERIFRAGVHGGQPTDHVHVTHHGHEITVFRTGRVVITPPDHDRTGPENRSP